MSEINDGGPAFPVPDTVPDTVHTNGQVEYGSPGMSLRDWFAGQALASGIIDLGEEGTVADAAEQLGIPAEDYIGKIHWPIVRAKRAYKIADSMLAEREGKQNARPDK